MRKRRIKVVGETAVYHCISRVVGGSRLLGDVEKEVLRKQMRQVADFCGVEVLTYCLMSNHIHLLIRVPSEETEVSDKELCRRYRVLYPKATKHQAMPLDVLEDMLKNDRAGADYERQKLLSRMHDLSEFMKTLKQRFTVWYNKRNHRHGTFWAERYKSVLVENDKLAKLTIAAYIDLNPVRARICEDPKDYRFSGYAEAVGGHPTARKGLAEILELGRRAPLKEVMQEYRLLLYTKGSAPDKGKIYETGKISEESASEVIQEKKGKLKLEEAVRCRIRYFTDGLILGNPEFVEKCFEANRAYFGEFRQSGSRKMKGLEMKGLFVARDLRRDVIGSS